MPENSYTSNTLLCSFGGRGEILMKKRCVVSRIWHRYCGKQLKHEDVGFKFEMLQLGFFFVSDTNVI